MYCGVPSRYPDGQRRRRRSRFVRIGRKSSGVNGLGVHCGLDSGFGPSTRWPTSRAGRGSRVAAAAVAAVRRWPCIACTAWCCPSLYGSPDAVPFVLGMRAGGAWCVACRSRRWCTVTASGFPGAVRLRCPSQRGRGCYPRTGTVLGVCRPLPPGRRVIGFPVAVAPSAAVCVQRLRVNASPTRAASAAASSYAASRVAGFGSVSCSPRHPRSGGV